MNTKQLHCLVIGFCALLQSSAPVLAQGSAIVSTGDEVSSTVLLSGIFCNSQEAATFVAQQFRGWERDPEQVRVRMALQIQRGRARSASNPIQERRWYRTPRLHPLWCEIRRSARVRTSSEMRRALADESELFRHKIFKVEVSLGSVIYQTGKGAGGGITQTTYFIVDSNLLLPETKRDSAQELFNKTMRGE